MTELDALKLALRFVRKTAETYGLKNDNLLIQKKLNAIITNKLIEKRKILDIELKQAIDNLRK